LGGLPQRRLHVLALVDHPLHVVGHLRALLAQALIADRLERADHMDRRANRLRQIGRLADGLAGCLGAVGSNNDRAEHVSPPRRLTGGADHMWYSALTCGPIRRRLDAWRRPNAWLWMTTTSSPRGWTCSSVT